MITTKQSKIDSSNETATTSTEENTEEVTTKEAPSSEENTEEVTTKKRHQVKKIQKK